MALLYTEFLYSEPSVKKRRAVWLKKVTNVERAEGHESVQVYGADNRASKTFSVS